MRSFRTSFLRYALLTLLAISANVAKAQINLAEILAGMSDPDNWFYTQLTARQSTVSGGSGQVSLTLVDMSGAPFATVMGNDVTPLVNAYNPGGNPTPYGATATMIGFAPLYMPGVETDLGGGMILSSYAYFLGNAQPADGSWFAGWSYTNGATDLGKADNTLFKILPSNQSSAAKMTSSSVYATFKPVLVTDYAGGRGEVVATAGSVGNVVVTIDVDGGDKTLSTADFNMPSLPTGWAVSAWDYNTTNAGKLTLNITYTAQASVVAGNEYKTTMTFSSKGGSALNVPLIVRAVAADRSEATVVINDVEYNETWTAALARANANAGALLRLNQNVAVAATQTITGAMTLDLNGYTLSSSSATVLTVNAAGKAVTLQYSKYGGSIASSSTAIDLRAGTLTLDGGSVSGATAINVQSGATLVENGATISGTACGILNSGNTTITDGSVSGTTYAVDVKAGSLTLRGGSLSGATALYVEAGTADVVRTTISGGAYGVLSKGTTTVEKLAMIDATGVALSVAGGTTTVNSGKFSAPTPLAKTAGTLNLISGYFKTSSIGVAVPAGKQLWNVTTGVEYTQGYTYYLGASASCVCKIGDAAYSTLEAALAYANNNLSREVVILMQNNYTLPAGYYTLPANATLIIPMNLEQETGYPIINRYSSNSVTSVPYVQPTEFLRLTFASGVNMDVRGTIEITGSQLASDKSYAAVPHGPYGHLVMEEGSHMTLGNGALLRVWGFMTGKGETDVRRGATVREQFQMGDWKGGSTSFGMLSDSRHVFPLTQYYIQSVESPVKYHPGAVLSSTTSVSAAASGLAVTAMANDIKIVGISGEDEAMFLMEPMADAENTWVRKWYDVENDIQTYEVNSGAHIGSMVLDLGKLGTTPLAMNSGWFVLPITNNMKIHLLSGSMDFTQSTSLLPGAEVEVDKEATVSVAYTPDIVSGTLYLYDADEWGNYAYDEGGNKKTKAVKYSPSWNGQPTARNLYSLPDAMINVHGTFDTADGYVFTSDGGANIFSTNEDAGTFRFTSAASEFSSSVYQVEGRSNYQSSDFASAKLKNGDGTYASTAGTAAGKSYCYMNGRWTMMDVDPDNECFFVDNYGQFYIKPSEFVAVNATKTAGVFSGNADHTYSDAAGDGRLFILLPDNCQWWEVENVDNLYHCIHPNNDTYYYWDDVNEMWVEKRFTITWNNWDGTPIVLSDGSDEYSVTYGTMAEYLGSNPTREATVDYTYDFTGWSPALAPVTSDVTYTATYSAVQRKYTIIFQKEGGQEIERHFLTRDEMPVCEDEPVKTGYILQWEPSVAAVTGDQTYTATWLAEKPATYTITWKNYNGTTLYETAVPADADASTVAAAYTATPAKPATTEYSYEFDRWNPAIAPATANATYTAVFREVGKTYTVTFEDELGNVIENNSYLYGATPVCSSVPAKDNTAEFSYAFAWTPQIHTVTGDATYRATFTPTRNQYTVTLRSTNDAVCSFSGAGIYEYGSSVTISAIVNSSEYEFVEWLEDHSASATREALTITGDVALTAVVQKKAVPDMTIGLTDVQNIVSATDVRNLVLLSDGTSSGQLKGAESLTVWGNADFCLTLNAAARTWYAVAVPWQVDATSGISIVGGRQLVLGTDLDVVYYDGASRAANGTEGANWHFLEYEADKTLYPGRLYMIYLAQGQTALQFRKKYKTPLCTESLSVAAYAAADAQDANWNGIANPATYYAYLNAGIQYAQTYDPSAKSYSALNMSATKLVVGQPVFVQAPAAKTVVANASAYSPVSRRVEARSADIRCAVELAKDGRCFDRIFIQTAEDKPAEYVIGEDLAKVGVSTIAPQMWIDRYDARLCVNTASMLYGSVDYPLVISVPADGQYRLTLAEATDLADKSVYVTLDGAAVWNLADGTYLIDLEAGSTARYGLRIAEADAPASLESSMATDAAAYKVLINGVVYIVRGSDVFTVTGQKVNMSVVK